MLKFEYIALILLIGYIVFLHIQLVKRRHLIEMLIERIFGPGRKLKQNELRRLLENMKGLNIDKYLQKDRYMDEQVKDFILSGREGIRIFVHSLSSWEEAEKIINNGFRFVGSFHHEAEELVGDRLEVIIRQNSRNRWGEVLVIIGIAEEHFKRFQSVLSSPEMKAFSIEHILASSSAEQNEPEDIYLLPREFIRGCVSLRTGEVKENPFFKPGFLSPEFEINVNSLKNPGDHRKVSPWTQAGPDRL